MRLPDDGGDPVGDRPCELCGSTATSTVIEHAADYITNVPFRVRQCASCRLARTDPQPDSMERYYPAAYRRYGGAALRTLRLLYGWRVRGWARRLPRAGRVLEVGCGDGWMLGALRDRGWRVVGNERTLDAARSAAAVNRIPVFAGDLAAIGPSSRFDLVIFFQVLEHLASPFAALRRGAESLAPRGIMVVAVPNFASWQARLFGHSWLHLDVPRHLYHFSPETLAYAYEQVGLRVIRTRHVSLEHDPYGWVQSTLNRLGFEQNLLTKLLMGMADGKTGLVTTAIMFAVAAVLVIPALVIAMISWLADSGAIIETWGVRK